MERYASAEKNAVVLRDAVSSEAPLLQRYVIRRVLEQLAGKTEGSYQGASGICAGTF